jgi:hypothetical protein
MSLTLREESRLSAFENSVFRRILGPRRDEVTGEWRKLHNEEINDLYSSPNVFWMIRSLYMRCGGAYGMYWGSTGTYGLMVGRPDVT